MESEGIDDSIVCVSGTMGVIGTTQLWTALKSCTNLYSSGLPGFGRGNMGVLQGLVVVSFRIS